MLQGCRKTIFISNKMTHVYLKHIETGNNIFLGTGENFPEIRHQLLFLNKKKVTSGEGAEFAATLV
jgi:hypothetical protein